MKFTIFARQTSFLTLTVVAPNADVAREAAECAPLDCWDHTVEHDEFEVTECDGAGEEEEAKWRVREDGELEAYEEGGEV